MTEKEVAELRRRLKPEKNSITHVRGCYVNQQREIVAQFNHSLGLMAQEDGERLLETLRRTLAGIPGRNLIDIAFETAQVVDSPEHRRLMDLRGTGLADDAAVEDFFRLAAESVQLEGSYLMLLAHDTYDVPYRSRDGGTQEDASSEVFSYILCSICPIKQTKPALSYYIRENEFHSLGADWIVGAPEAGFVFPAFDDRSANIYSALYCTRDIAQHQEDFVTAVFNRSLPMPAAAQKESFQAVLGDALAEDCSLEVVQAVHQQLDTLIATHKESKSDQPLIVTGRDVRDALKDSGVPEPRLTAFEEQFETRFGRDAQLSPRNLAEGKTLVSTPDVSIQVRQGRGDLVETRIIGGVPYILIRAEDGVEVNGVQVRIP